MTSLSPCEILLYATSAIFLGCGLYLALVKPRPKNKRRTGGSADRLERFDWQNAKDREHDKRGGI